MINQLEKLSRALFIGTPIGHLIIVVCFVITLFLPGVIQTILAVVLLLYVNVTIVLLFVRNLERMKQNRTGVGAKTIYIMMYVLVALLINSFLMNFAFRIH